MALPPRAVLLALVLVTAGCSSYLGGRAKDLHESLLTPQPEAHLGVPEQTLPAGPDYQWMFNPLEFADFLMGWFGLDLMGDDPDEVVPEPETAR